MLIRKLGKTLRGQAKPYQIITAAILGSLIGFAPPIGTAPLYLVAVILLLVIINANLFIATGTAAIAKLLALILMPVSFELGLLLVDGPLQGLFRLLINAPITALMGFDYYVTSGGAVLALIVGGGLGFGYIKLISGFRKKMASLEADSEKYKSFIAKRSVRFGMWILFGGKAKMTYAEMMEQKKVGNPVRTIGVVFAVLVVGLLIIAQQFFVGPLVTAMLQKQLENFNGATVDVEGVTLNLSSGELTVDRLAMADPDKLTHDIFRANQLSAKISTADLLRKRITIDWIVTDDAHSGKERDQPGVLIAKPDKPEEPKGQGKSIEDWFEKAKTWKQRLDTFREWQKKIEGPPKDEEAQEQTVKDKLREWADRYGSAGVRATHLVEGSPTVLVKKIEVKKMQVNWPEGESMDILATYISTHPALAEEKPRIRVTTSEDSFKLDLSIAPAAMTGETSTLNIELRNQSIDKTMADLDLGETAALKGGTWRVRLDSKWDTDNLDFPLTFELQNTDLTLPLVDKTVKDQTLPLTFNVTGAMDNPQLKLDVEKLAATTMAIAKKELGDAAFSALKGALEKEVGGEAGKKISDIAKGLLPGGKKDKDGDNKDKDKDDDKKDDLIKKGLDLIK